MIRKIIGITLCFIAMITRTHAQELGIELDGGLQGTRYPLQNGQIKQLPGGSFGVNYTFRLGSRWGLLTGITGGLYRTQATLPDGAAFSYYQVDDEGSAFQYNLKATGYKETQQFFAASIPLLLQYHSAGAGTQWWFDGGGKVLVPFNTSIKVSAAQLSLSGYYPDFNLLVSNLPQHGFGELKGWKGSASSELKPAAALTAATGFSFPLSPGTRLYTGVYVDYGLTDLKEKNGTMPLLTYSSTGINGVQANSVLNMQSAGQVVSLSFGVQVRLSFGSTKAKPAARAKTKEEPQQQQRPADSALSDDQADAMEAPVVFGIIGETIIPEMQKPHLDEVVNILNQFPKMRISIVGHTCNSGTETENKKVGAARANAVARYLRRKGIDRSRMDVSSLGESDPDDPSDPAANFQNRRADIIVK